MVFLEWVPPFLSPFSINDSNLYHKSQATSNYPLNSTNLNSYREKNHKMVYGYTRGKER